MNPCTCLGSCRGAEGLGANWYCVLQGPPAPPPLDPERCAICGWPLSGTACERGNCSERPLPRRYYDAERARREYAPLELQPEDPPTVAESELAALRKLEVELRRRPALLWRGLKEGLVELDKIRGAA